MYVKLLYKKKMYVKLFYKYIQSNYAKSHNELILFNVCIKKVLYVDVYKLIPSKLFIFNIFKQ